MLSFSQSFFFFNDTATTEIYTLSLHDALPISDDDQVVGVLGVVLLEEPVRGERVVDPVAEGVAQLGLGHAPMQAQDREEHTSELQSRQYLVCRLLLEKKKNTMIQNTDMAEYTA